MFLSKATIYELTVHKNAQQNQDILTQFRINVVNINCCDFRRLHMDDFELSKGMDFEKVKGLWKNSDSDEAVIITYRKSREHVYEFSGDIYYFSYKHKT